MKTEISQKVLWGIGAVAVVGLIGILFYVFRASDPASRGPIPYKKFDYGAHMQQQARDFNRQPVSATAAPGNNAPANR